MKTTLLFVLMLFVFASCSNKEAGGDTTAQTDSTNNTVVNETSTAQPALIDPAASGSTENTLVASKITDEVVNQMCECVSNSKTASGGLDVDKMRACMGGNMITFVANLLGDEATDKDRSDAEQELTKRMNSQCK